MYLSIQIKALQQFHLMLDASGGDISPIADDVAHVCCSCCWCCRCCCCVVGVQTRLPFTANEILSAVKCWWERQTPAHKLKFRFRIPSDGQSERSSGEGVWIWLELGLGVGFQLWKWLQ